MRRQHPEFQRKQRPIEENLDALDKNTKKNLEEKYVIAKDCTDLNKVNFPKLTPSQKRIIDYIHAWHKREYGKQNYAFEQWLKNHVQRVSCLKHFKNSVFNFYFTFRQFILLETMKIP